MAAQTPSAVCDCKGPGATMHKDVPVRPQVIAKSEGNLQTKLNIARIIARAEHLSKLVIRPAIQAVADICACKIVTEKFAAERFTTQFRAE